MRFDDDFNNVNSGENIMYMALGVSFFILLVLGVVFFLNRGNNSSGKNYKKYVAANTPSVSEGVKDGEKSDKLTADDLDIWNMYKETDEVSDDAAKEISPKVSPTVSPLPTISPMSDDEKYNDGKHFKIELADGSFEWIAIDKKRPLNTYDFTNMKESNGKRKYFAEGKQVSFTGIDVSRYQKNIDFAQVKNAGIDFVMIRVGARGYQTGKIAVDEFFEQNIKAAKEAGLDVGVYFYSQAITPQEASEEAAVVVQALTNYKINYPVAYDMEEVENDVSRIDKLTKDERTVISATFINALMAAGYKTLLYGNEEWLTKKVDLTKFPVVSVWLADSSDMPDYPYQYAMWQYSTKGSVYGVDGNVNMNICFIDYAAQ